MLTEWHDQLKIMQPTSSFKSLLLGVGFKESPYKSKYKIILYHIYSDFTSCIPQTSDPDAWLQHGCHTLLSVVIASITQTVISFGLTHIQWLELLDPVCGLKKHLNCGLYLSCSRFVFYGPGQSVDIGRGSPVISISTMCSTTT